MSIGIVSAILLVLLVLSNLWWLFYYTNINNYWPAAPLIVISVTGTLVAVVSMFYHLITFIYKHW